MTDTGMTIAHVEIEFTILCVLQSTIAGVEWWNDIWGNSVQYSAPFEACWNGNYDYPNYTLAVSDTTVYYSAGSCDAECEVASTWN